MIWEGPGWLAVCWLAARAAWAGQAGRWVAVRGPGSEGIWSGGGKVPVSRGYKLPN